MNIQDVKNIIGFEKTDPFYASLNGIVDCTYQIALKQGKTEDEAVSIAFERLEEEINSLPKN